MSIWKIAWRSIQHRALSSGLTAFSMALGVALVVTVIVIHSVIDQSFRRGVQGYDLIVGPRGSSLELVLNTVFYLGQGEHTIPYRYYEELRFGRYSADVEVAIPIALGGVFRGAPLVATTPEFFEWVETSDARSYTFREGGRNMRAGGFFEAVVGHRAASQANLRVGDTFRIEHGIPDDDDDDDEFTVVGILRPSATPNDQAIFINLEGFYEMHAHHRAGVLEQALRGTRPTTAVTATGEGENGQENDGDDTGMTHAHDHGDFERRLSAILVVTRNQAATAAITRYDMFGAPTEITIDATRGAASPIIASLQRRIGEEMLEAHAVSPVFEIQRLFEGIIGDVQMVLIILAVLIIVVAGIGMMVSIYNSMNERRQEIAIMRALGASRTTVMGIILSESILLSLGGGLVGVIIGHGMIGILGPQIMEYTGIIVSAWHFQPAELILIPGLILLASIVGCLPAVIAYTSDVAQSPSK